MLRPSKLFVLAAVSAMILSACGGATATPTPVPSNTPVITAVATTVPTAEATMEMTMEATEEMTAEATMEMTMEATEEMTAEATMEMTEEMTAEATMEMTMEARVEATEEVTAEATMEMTMEATMEATEEVTAEATMEMTEEMTPEATMEMTMEATMEATEEMTPEATPTMEVMEMTPEATMEMTPMADQPTWTCPADFSGQTLSLYNWAEYIGRTTVSDFTELCQGVIVTVDYFDTNETLITKMRAGNPGYDVAFPNDYAIQILSNEGLLETVNRDNIPNAVNVADRWQGMFFDANNEYGVPYLWSSFGILYNKNKVTTPPTSWSDFFNYEGSVQWIDDYRGMFGAAFWLMGEDASTTDPDAIEKAADFLKANGSNAVSINGGFTDGLENGEVDMIMTYSAYAYELLQRCECDDYAYVVPQEGSAVDVTDAVILKGADNIPLAEAFIDYLNDPYVAAQIVNDTGYNTTNQAALDSGFILPEVLDNPALFVEPDTLNKLEFYRPITDAEGLYQQYWDEVRIQLGIGN